MPVNKTSSIVPKVGVKAAVQSNPQKAQLLRKAEKLQVEVKKLNNSSNERIKPLFSAISDYIKEITTVPVKFL